MGNTAKWFKMYSGVLLTDDTTAILSPAAFGAWIRVICTMHENGKPSMTKPVKHWARIFGCAPDAAEEIICELVDAHTGQVERDGDYVTMGSKRMDETLQEQEEARRKAQERKERYRTRSERVRNDSRTERERFGSTSTSLSTSTSSSKSKNKVSENEHVAAYEKITHYTPALFHQDYMALKLKPYPLDAWEAHVQVWMDTDKWNEKSAKRMVDAFIEQQQKAAAGHQTTKGATCVECGQPKTYTYMNKAYCDKHGPQA